jgi:hypothetical protein
MLVPPNEVNVAPRLASAKLAALPRPEVAPVMTAVLPVIRGEIARQLGEMFSPTWEVSWGSRA